MMRFFGCFLAQGLFSFRKFLENATVPISLLFDKYYPIMYKLGLKDSSREFRLNCVINFIFYLYLMLHVCVKDSM
jgi:hypothetical protein